jgi:hypothetical protein
MQEVRSVILRLPCFGNSTRAPHRIDRHRSHATECDKLTAFPPQTMELMERNKSYRFVEEADSARPTERSNPAPGIRAVCHGRGAGELRVLCGRFALQALSPMSKKKDGKKLRAKGKDRDRPDDDDDASAVVIPERQKRGCASISARRPQLAAQRTGTAQASEGRVGGVQDREDAGGGVRASASPLRASRRAQADPP